MLVLDLDGTLLDCQYRQTELAASLALDMTGSQLDRPRFWFDKREGASTAQALENQITGRDKVERLSALWNSEIEQDDWLLVDRALPGAQGSLDELRARRIALVLLTARNNDQGLYATIKRLGWVDYFESIRRVNPRFAAEEKAEILREVSPQLFIGDTESDWRASQLAMINFAAVSSGQRSEQFLRRRGIEAVFPSIAAAVQYFLNSVRLDCSNDK